jgi:UDP-N-acetyl-D-mannosaminuronate dehydrogenase
VVDVIKELQTYSVNVEVYDPYADNEEFEHEYGVSLVKNPNNEYDAVIVAVNHDQFTNYTMKLSLDQYDETRWNNWWISKEICERRLRI